MQACCMQGTLAGLDSRNPVLYINFPEGRLKFFGTIVFPKNKYMVLKFGNKDVLCEDVLENMVSTASEILRQGHRAASACHWRTERHILVQCHQVQIWEDANSCTGLPHISVVQHGGGRAWWQAALAHALNDRGLTCRLE